MKTLVIGSAGQVGSALVRLAPAGREVVSLTRAGLDLTDTGAIERAIEAHAPTLIFNAAAYTAVDLAETERELAHAVNAVAPGAMAAAASRIGARLIHISTDFVFDGASPSPYRPEDALNPLGVYGATKAAGEEAVRAALPDALIVRTAWVHAAAGRNFARTMLTLMAERDEVRVVGDQIGTPTHAASIAAALWRLAERGAGGTLHFTDNGVASWYDFAVAIQEEALALGLLSRAVPVLPIATADYPTPARRPANSVLDKSATWALIRPARHWRAELRTMLGEMKDNRDG